MSMQRIGPGGSLRVADRVRETREMVLGGVTREMFRSMTVPLFMAH